MHKNLRVLLADSQVWLRSALRLFLEHECAVEIVGEVENASTLTAATVTLQPDLILLDWELTGMKTATARQRQLATLRAAQPQVYIVAMSGQEDARNEWQLGGADAFVSKAEPPQRLQAVIQRFYAPR